MLDPLEMESIGLYVLLGLIVLMMFIIVISILFTTHRPQKHNYSFSGFRSIMVLLEFMATILIIVMFHVIDFSYRFYISISRIYEIMVSNIGLTAVIAAAGLGLTALVNPPYEVDRRLYWTEEQRREFQESGREAEIIIQVEEKQKLSDEKRRFSVFLCSTVALSLVVILSVCYYTGITRFTAYDDGFAYNGATFNNMADGYGTLYSMVDEHVVYRGSFKNNQYNGEGILYKKRSYSDGSEKYEYAYIGHFENNQYNGQGIEFLFDNDHNYIAYLGEFKDGVYSGAGKWYNYRESYAGDPVDISVISKGIYFATDKYIEDSIDTSHLFLRYEGMFERNMYNGKGIYYGILQTDWGEDRYLKYDGDFVNSKFEGQGQLYFPGNIVKYDGGFSDEQYSGFGIEYVLNEDRTDHRKWYEGWFINGLYDGEGTLFDSEGNPIRRGVFSEGEFVGEAGGD